MNQPKFKLGDKVIEQTPGYEGEPFVVTRMQSFGERICIWTPDARLSLQENFSLYQEPQKKKLYAFWTLMKVFHDHDFGIEVISFHPDLEYCKGSPHMRHAPEYDIEYPTKE